MAGSDQPNPCDLASTGFTKSDGSQADHGRGDVCDTMHQSIRCALKDSLHGHVSRDIYDFLISHDRI